MKQLWLVLLASVSLTGVAHAGGLDDAKAGFAAAKRGEYQAAVYFSTLALESGELSAKTQAIAHNNRGYAHDLLGAGGRAIFDYGQAIRIDPKFAVAYNNWGFVLNAKGEHVRAAADFSEAIRLKPNYADAFNNRGIAFANLADLDRAIEDYNQAIKLNPTLYQAYNNRGYARFQLGQFDTAARDLDVVVRVRPNYYYSILWHHLASMRADKANQEVFAAHAERLDLEEWPGPVMRLFLGELSVDEMLDIEFDADPKRARQQRCELFFYLGQYHLLAGDKSAAVEAFQKAVESGLPRFTEFRAAERELRHLGRQRVSDVPAKLRQ